MTDAKTPAQLADDAAEGVRGLNHATLSPGRPGWEFPADAYSVIGGLDRMAGYLFQSMDQTWSLLSGLAVDGHVRSDRGDTDRDLTEAQMALEDAKVAAEALREALARAHSATSPLAFQE